MHNPNFKFVNVEDRSFGPFSENHYSYVHNGPENETDPSGLREADDDPKNPAFLSLQNVNTSLDSFVNSAIDSARKELQINAGDAINDKLRDSLVGLVFTKLGQDVPGTGVDTPKGSVSQLNSAEVWADALAHGTERVQLSIKNSKYSGLTTGKLGVAALSSPPWMWSDETAQHGLAPTIKVNNVLMGSDKWGHFFQQGYWYFMLDKYLAGSKITFGAKFLFKEERTVSYSYTPSVRDFGYFLEGDRDALLQAVPKGGPPLAKSGEIEFSFPNAPKDWTDYVNREFGLGLKVPWTYTAGIQRFYEIAASGLKGKNFHFGEFGSYSTGQVSIADMNANNAGLDFYQKLWADPANYVFSAASIDVKSFNETVVPNKQILTH